MYVEGADLLLTQNSIFDATVFPAGAREIFVAPEQVDIVASRNNFLSDVGSSIFLDGVNGNVVSAGGAQLFDPGTHGGRTRNMPPMVGSPVINAGDASVVEHFRIQFDQRGEGHPRTRSGAVDIGAIESDGETLSFMDDGFESAAGSTTGTCDYDVPGQRREHPVRRPGAAPADQLEGVLGAWPFAGASGEVFGRDGTYLSLPFRVTDRQPTAIRIWPSNLGHDYNQGQLRASISSCAGVPNGFEDRLNSHGGTCTIAGWTSSIGHFAINGHAPVGPPATAVTCELEPGRTYFLNLDFRQPSPSYCSQPEGCAIRIVGRPS